MLVRYIPVDRVPDIGSPVTAVYLLDNETLFSTNTCWLYRDVNSVNIFLMSSVRDIFLGYRAAPAVPPPFRPGEPALCGSHPLVTPY